MKKFVQTPKRHNLLALITTIVMNASLITLISISPCYGELAFFMATRDEQIYAKSPSKYEQEIFPSNSGRKIYFHRDPLLTISDDEIELITVEISQMDRDLNDVVEKAFQVLERKRSKKGKDTKDYVVTFFFKEQGAKKFRSFAHRHTGEMFAVKFKSLILGVPTLIGSFEGKGNDFALMGLDEDGINRLKKIFSPIKDKVIWK